MQFPTQTPLLASLLMTAERTQHAGASIKQILLLIPVSTLMVHSELSLNTVAYTAKLF
jgi:hypothetical protein